MPSSDSRFMVGSPRGNILRVTDTLTGDYAESSEQRWYGVHGIADLLNFVNEMLGVQHVEIRHVCVDKEAPDA